MTAQAEALDPVLLEEAARALDVAPGSLSLLHVNGWGMDFRSVTTLVFTRGASSPSLVAKVAFGSARESLAAERDNLELLSRSTSARLRESVPRLLGYRDEDRRSVLLETVVAGEPFAADTRPARVVRFIDLATDWLVAFHRGTGASPAALAEATLDRLFRQPFAAYLARFAPGDGERRWLERKLGEVDQLSGIPLPLVYHHNDFGPPNLLVDGSGASERLGVIDWDTPFAPRLPAADLIHLLACLGPAPGGPGDDGLGRYRSAFFEDNPVSRAARSALTRYAQAMDVPLETLRLLFTACWIDYALEKAAAVEAARGGEAGAGGPARDLGVWSLAHFADGTCANLRLLAEGERSLVLP